MIRSTARWVPQLASAELRSTLHQQRRSKTFVRRVDKNDQIYYTLARKGPSENPDSVMEHGEFFEMPDLLLDLDAEGNHNIRSSEEADEQLMRTKWAVMPRRESVKSRLGDLEQQLDESRRKVDGIISDPTNVWRLTSHDIFSAALRGPPANRQGELAADASGNVSHQRDNLDWRKGSDILDTIRLENGIPAHALDKDELFLQWMMLRRKGLDHSKKGNRESPLSPAQLGEALQKQTSITGIRRLVFQSLTGANSRASLKQMGFGSSADAPLDISREIRNVCLKVCKQNSGDAAFHLEALTFLGSLTERLSRHHIKAGASIIGLALRLSAEAGFPQATSEWLHRGFTNNIWHSNAEVASDVLSTLRAFLSALQNTTQQGCFQSAHERQLLLQLLTGINEHNEIIPDSLRTLAMTGLRRNSEVAAQQAFDIYESYIMLLGHLGAVRTLWKEGRMSAQECEKLLTKGGVSKGDVATLFHASLSSALAVAPAPSLSGEALSDPSLDECVTADYHSIEMQDSNLHVQGGGESANTGVIGVTLGLPLNEWLNKVEELLVRKV